MKCSLSCRNAEGDVVHLGTSRTALGINAVGVQATVGLLIQYIEEHADPIRKEFNAFSAQHD